jgi:microsomal epoxide hydrolase
MPLLLMHGWPGSVFEFMEIIPRLIDPVRFGGDPRDAFTVIAPSLPGFGLSFRPGQPRFSIEQIADCLYDLMRNVLGFERFGAQGGDYGAFTATRLGIAHPESLVGIHLNFLVVRRDLPVPTMPSREERAYFDDLARWTKMEIGYTQIQGTKPQTLAYGLTDSPAGLAAWLVEKFRTWVRLRRRR